MSRLIWKELCTTNRMEWTGLYNIKRYTTFRKAVEMSFLVWLMTSNALLNPAPSYYLHSKTDSQLHIHVKGVATDLINFIKVLSTYHILLRVFHPPLAGYYCDNIRASAWWLRHYITTDCSADCSHRLFLSLSSCITIDSLGVLVRSLVKFLRNFMVEFNLKVYLRVK